MDKIKIRVPRKKLEKFCRRNNIRKLAFFGSVLRKDMLGMRNAAIHEYDDLDLDLVWDTTTRDLPDLVKELETIISIE